MGPDLEGVRLSPASGPTLLKGKEVGCCSDAGPPVTKCMGHMQIACKSWSAQVVISWQVGTSRGFLAHRSGDKLGRAHLRERAHKSVLPTRLAQSQRGSWKENSQSLGRPVSPLAPFPAPPAPPTPVAGEERCRVTALGSIVSRAGLCLSAGVRAQCSAGPNHRHSFLLRPPQRPGGFPANSPLQIMAPPLPWPKKKKSPQAEDLGAWG